MPIKKSVKKPKQLSADIEIILGEKFVTANLLSYPGWSASHPGASTKAPIVIREGESYYRAAQRAGNIAVQMLCNENKIPKARVI